MTDQTSADRPRVVVAVSASADGRLTLHRDCLLLNEDALALWRSVLPPGAQAAEDARTAELDRRHHPEAVLEGSGSLVPQTAGPLWTAGDDPGAPAGELYQDFVPDEVAHRPGHRKWFAVVDGRGRVRWTMTRQREFDLLVLVARATPAAYLAYLRREGIAYLVAGAGRVDLGGALRRMRERLGVTCVVSTAGGALNGALLRAGLVDEIELVVLPAAIGGAGTPAIFDGEPLADGEAPTRLRLAATHVAADGVLRLRYDVVR
jgi:2,5-diamino-6-(ribosylamino)-4(3H)-pyrimidinone 5'-phosphate reductase